MKKSAVRNPQAGPAKERRATPAADHALASATAALRAGEIVAVPTETYYALAVDARSEAALERLFVRKGRALDHAVSVLLLPTMLGDLVAGVPPRAQALMDAHWPGPLTLALPARPGLPRSLVHDACIAVRVSPHPLVQALLERFGHPVTATSANRSGTPPSQSPEQVRRDFPDLIVLGSEPTAGGLASTVVRVTWDEFAVVRRGPIEVFRDTV